MSIHNKIQDLQNQIQETKNLLSLVVGHPIMEPSLKERLAILEEELSTIPKNIKESKIRLLFSGVLAVSPETAVRLKISNNGDKGEWEYIDD